jgi:uncharacterized protein (TIGR02271 family)
MITATEVRELIGASLLDSDGNKIGTIGQVFLDDDTGAPEWATVNTGLFGSSESFVPLAESHRIGDDLQVPYPKDRVKDAPNVSPDHGHLDQSEEAKLYGHYGLDYSESRSDSGLPSGGRDRQGSVGDGGAALDGSDGTTDDAMTRSEEQVRTGTESVTAGKARLRKWVETEDVNVSVPVTKEKARLVTEPIDETNRGSALDGPDISEDEHEVTLTEERPVVSKETVPVERVKLEKESVQTEEQVSETVRKERIAADGDVDLTAGERSSTR